MSTFSIFFLVLRNDAENISIIFFVLPFCLRKCWAQSALGYDAYLETWKSKNWGASLITCRSAYSRWGKSILFRFLLLLCFSVSFFRRTVSSHEEISAKTRKLLCCYWQFCVEEFGNKSTKLVAKHTWKAALYTYRLVLLISFLSLRCFCPANQSNLFCFVLG